MVKETLLGIQAVRKPADMTQKDITSPLPSPYSPILYPFILIFHHPLFPFYCLNNQNNLPSFILP